MNPSRAVITFRGAETEVIMKALSPEAGRDVPRASVKIACSPGATTLTIDAEDTAAMRAALNSYLRWADVAVRVAKEVRE